MLRLFYLPVLLLHQPQDWLLDQFLAKYPGSRHVTYDAVSYSGMLLANEASYGKRAIPSYNFAAAKVIVGLNSDFLASGLVLLNLTNNMVLEER